jgi:hypothetical protein
MAKPPTVVMEADTALILHAFEAYCVGNSAGHHARRRAGQPPMPDVSARVARGPDDMCGLEPLTVFHSSSTIPMTLVDLAKVMQRATKSNDEVTLVSVILMCRFASRSIAVTRHMMHRLYIAALHLSLKAHNDEFYTNATYAKAAGVSLAEMNRLEVHLAIGLNWNCCVLLDPACGRDGSTDTTRREALLELAEVSLRAAPEVREDSATMADSASVGGGKRASSDVEDSPTVCGASIASDSNTTLSNADFLASTLTVSLQGGNSSYLLQQSDASTSIDQSSVMIADSTMTIIGGVDASAETVFLTGPVNESSVVVQSCHITTMPATSGTLFTLQSPSTVGIMSSNITAEGVEFDCTGGSCAALSASGYAVPRPISRTAITFTSATFRTNASVSATVIDLIDSTFTDGMLVQVHDAAVRNSAAHGMATFLKGTAASVISAAASVNVTDTTVQLDGNTSALLSFDGLMNTAAAFSVARTHIGLTATRSGHLLRGSRLIGNAAVRLVDVRADCIARDDAFCGVWWVAVSGEASNGTKSLHRVRMSGFPTSASAMAEQAMCSLERSFLNGKPLQVEDGRAVCDPTTSTASFVHTECASQTGSSSISNTLSASDVSATMSGETASPSRTTPTHRPTTAEGPFTTKQLWMERLQRVTTPQVEWHEAGGGTRQLRQLGMFFAAYKHKAPWFVLVEVLWVNVAASIAAALSVVISCAAAVWYHLRDLCGVRGAVAVVAAVRDEVGDGGAGGGGDAADAGGRAAGAWVAGDGDQRDVGVGGREGGGGRGVDLRDECAGPDHAGAASRSVRISCGCTFVFGRSGGNRGWRRRRWCCCRTLGHRTPVDGEIRGNGDDIIGNADAAARAGRREHHQQGLSRSFDGRADAAATARAAGSASSGGRRRTDRIRTPTEIIVVPLLRYFSSAASKVIALGVLSVRDSYR